MLVSDITADAFADNETVESITIPDTVTTIEEGAIPENVTIYAPEGSAAEQYADDNNFAFAELITSDLIKIKINKTTGVLEITGKGKMREPLYNYLVSKEHYLESVKGAMESYFSTEVDLVYDETLTDIVAIDDNIRYFDHATGEELFVDEALRLALNPANFLEFSPTTIVVGEGITSIPDYAFLLCNDVEEVVLPSTVETIGDAAFLYCGNLKRVILPENATIGESAFNYCYNLELVVLATAEYYAPAPQNDGPMMVDDVPTSTNLTADDVYRLIYC